MKKISIITVVLNAADTIERTIKSVLSQSYKDIEYIIIDGGSTDGTLNVIEQYRNRLAYFVSEQDNGIYDAMNKGIKKATGDIIGLLNADDWYEPEAIDVVAREYERSNAHIIVGKTWYVDKNDNKRLQGNRSFDELWKNIGACSQSIFISKDAYNKFGLYDTRYKIAADYDLMLRMYHAGARVSLINDILANYRTTGISNTSWVECCKEYYSIIQQWYRKYPGKERVINELHTKKLISAKFNFVLEHCSEKICLIISKISDNYMKDYVIWGIGKWGQKIYDIFLNHRIKVSFFVDSNRAKWGTVINGVYVKSPDVLESYKGTVFIAVKDYDEEIADTIAAMSNPNVKYVLLRDFIDAVAKCYDDFERKNGSVNVR